MPLTLHTTFVHLVCGSPFVCQVVEVVSSKRLAEDKAMPTHAARLIYDITLAAMHGPVLADISDQNDEVHERSLHTQHTQVAIITRVWCIDCLCVCMCVCVLLQHIRPLVPVDESFVEEELGEAYLARLRTDASLLGPGLPHAPLDIDAYNSGVFEAALPPRSVPSMQLPMAQLRADAALGEVRAPQAVYDLKRRTERKKGRGQ